MVWIEILSVWPNDAVKKYPDLIEIGNIFELGKNATIQIGLNVKHSNFIHIKS
jgi:hypothetical protein